LRDAITGKHDDVDHTLQAVSRLRRLLDEHEARGDADTPFHLGIREALEDLDAAEDQSTAA
jgi:hypothetical protein